MVGTGLVGLLLGALAGWTIGWGSDPFRWGMVTGYSLAWLIYRVWLRGQRRGLGW